ncbi:MAG: hypothetical protein ACI9K5_003526 [Gammaproteobacteria bacterium]|jgi:hypothetical protein
MKSMNTSRPSAVQDAISRLEAHRVYAEVRDLDRLRLFLEHHVVCVLDFMTLLKRLQGELTCTASPWVPTQDVVSTRLINEIVLDEESDAAFGPHPVSHYRWYLAAMDEVGANTAPIREFEARLRRGVPPSTALEGCALPPAAEAFARTTFELAAGPVHVVAGAFVLGREDVIPRMFIPLVLELRAAGVPCELFLRYLERHIEIDAQEHGPIARQLLDRIVDGNPAWRDEAYGSALRSLEARERLWNAVATACQTQDERPARPETSSSLEAISSARTDLASR